MSSGTGLENCVKRDDRRIVEVAALAFRTDGTSHSVKLRNISYEGCLLESDTILSVGEKITLAMPRMGEMKAQIRWTSADGKAGAQFIAEEIRANEPHSRVGL